MDNSYKTIDEKTIFEGIVVDISLDTIVLPNGKTAKREVVEHDGGAAILPIDDEGNVILIRQYRHPLKKKLLEIPAGMVEPHEDHKACATRELEEEVGVVAKNVEYLCHIAPSVGYCSEIIHIYLGRGLEKGKQNLDPEEFIEIEKYPFEDALKMCLSGEIVDAKTIVSILAYNNLYKK